ncbi:hypothetical protein V6N13_101496 [Hibiscus sabdariffa]|uniref:TF-B3 domain-containing protein n=1 Tax=Hibiscus sabdariffa TaxID=183260 RepID=A0ABR2QLH6_9ROSI
MAAIGEVILAAHHERQWRFRDPNRTLPDGRIVLKVMDGSRLLEFECNRERDDVYCIKGSEWRRFVQQKKDAMLTLYSKEDNEDFHRIRVRQQHSSFAAAFAKGCRIEVYLSAFLSQKNHVCF